MNHAIKMTALAVFAASFAVPALANKSNELDLYVDSETQSLFSQPGPGRVKLGTFQPVDAKAQAQAKSAGMAATKGGLEIKSADGNFSAKLGGRIHFDGNYYVDEDDINAGAQNTKNDFFFRRTRLSVSGNAYDYKYMIDLGFENSSGGGTVSNNQFFRDVWIGRKVNGANVRLGQAKPYRGMEELTSSNEITFMERPFATATGIYPKQRTLGAFIDGSGEGYGWGVAVYSPRTAADTNASGTGVNARGYIIPVNTDGNIVHIGLSASADRYDTQRQRIRPRIVGREGGLRTSLLDGRHSEQDAVALELAAKFGGLTVQSEYVTSTFKDGLDGVDPTPDQDVDAYYVQASYFLTDHSKVYDAKKGVFKSPKVNGKDGAIELKARYDMIENKDVSGNEASYYTVGLNYYATPNTRFMLEYTDGEDKVGTDREASAITARAQFNF